MMRASPAHWLGFPARSACLAAATLVGLLSGCSGSSDGDMMGAPRTVSVGASGSADYASIGDAVRAAPGGSTIVVEPGRTTELDLRTGVIDLVGRSLCTLRASDELGVDSAGSFQVAAVCRSARGGLTARQIDGGNRRARAGGQQRSHKPD